MGVFVVVVMFYFFEKENVSFQNGLTFVVLTNVVLAETHILSNLKAPSAS